MIARFSLQSMGGATLGLVLIVITSACSKAPSPVAAVPATVTSPSFIAIARGRVDVDGGLVHLAAPRDGVVTQVTAQPGKSVQEGDILVVLDTRLASISLDLARAELDAANAQTAVLRAKLPGLKQRAARMLDAAKAGATSGQISDDAQQALAELNAEIALAQTAAATAQQKIRGAQLEVAVRTLRAPIAGRVTARSVHVGDSVSAQASLDLVEILPDAPRIVRAELNEGFIAKVTVGTRAEVYSESDSQRISSAHVTRIGEVFGPSRLAETGTDATDTRDVECILAFDNDGGNTALKVGQRVQVRFLP